MTEPTEYPPGTFCWVDLAATDLSAARRFYAGLFGWKAEEHPTGAVLLHKADRLVCSMYQLNDALLAEEVPSHWQSYVSVTDADATVEQARTLGATVLAAPMELPGVARIAAIADPTGALLGLWQPAPAIGARLVNEPNTLCWNELYTGDLAAAERFYAALFGWRAERPPSAPSVVQFTNGDRPAGTAMAIRPEWGPVPPHWAVYFAVADLDETSRQAAALGGRVDYGPMEIPGVGRFAGLEDPQGAHFVAIQLAPGAVA